MSERSWTEAAIAVPPPSARRRPKQVATVDEAAVRLLHEVGDVLAVLTRRSPADFRPLPSLTQACAAALQRALAADADPLPASLLVELAPLLEPRLLRLAPRLRRRLGRTRTLQAIGRIREADPACQRRNARRPGRTMLDKAGPRQELWGVRRIPRFDTTENRVLLAACQQFSKDIGATLAPLPGAARRGAGRAAVLRSLRRAADTVAARPELDGIGRPRPGERPSNALIGDADYRAAWRAWRLLRAEEARFTDDWLALDEAWLELVELATWAALDARDDLEPVAGWVHVHHRRAGGRRLHTDGPRRWVGQTESGPREVRVEVSPEGVRVAVRGPSDATPPIAVGAPLRVRDPGDGPCLNADRSVASQAAIQALEHLTPGLHIPTAVPRKDKGYDALSLLDTAVRGVRDGASIVLDACAVAELAVPDEAPVTALGRPASWRDDALGPAALWGSRPDLVGRFVSSLRGVNELAVVVPDAFDDLAQQRLRREAGPCWLVPSPVAAALALHRNDPPADDEVWLTVVRTAACLDIAILERQPDPEQPDHGVWIRSAPRHDGRGGRHEGLPRPLQGAAVRAEDGGGAVVLDESGPRPVTLPPEAGLDRQAITAVLQAWQKSPPTQMLLVGLSNEDCDAIEAELALRATRLPASALVLGAAAFQARHAAGLPTWKDRLPSVKLLVKRGRQRDTLTLIEPNHLVAPGDLVQHDPTERFSLDSATRRVRFPMTIDGTAANADLCIDGPPLPLPRAVEVRVRLSYVHGRQGLTVWLVPVGSAPFSRIQFHLVAAGGGDALASDDPRAPEPLAPPRAPYADEVDRLRASFDALRDWQQGVDKKVWRQALGQAGRFHRELREALDALRDEAEACLHGTTNEALPEELRGWLTTEVLPWLAWLSGCRFDAPTAADGADAHHKSKRERRRRGKGQRSRPRGPAPKLTRDEQASLIRTRAALRLPVDGDELYSSILAEAGPVPEAQWRRMLGRLCGASPTGGWSALVTLPVGSVAEEGALADGIVTALQGNPGLVGTLPAGDAEGLLRRLAEAVAAVAATPASEAIRRRRDVYFLLRGIETLLQVRHRGLLPPNGAAVQHVHSILLDARKDLPSEVVKFAEHTNRHHDDEQLSRTLDALFGRYGDLAGLKE